MLVYHLATVTNVALTILLLLSFGKFAMIELPHSIIIARNVITPNKEALTRNFPQEYRKIERRITSVTIKII